MLKQLLAILVDGVPPPQHRFIATLSGATHPFATSSTDTRFNPIREGTERERERWGREEKRRGERVVSLLPKQGL